ncbi:hypothetical protein evm_010464 [Chilo suppressalis]|nr:hypothetical protein evm_010464 [Chilo suppressalis]
MVISSILEEWNCRNKVVAIVADNAPVMIKVAENLKIGHVPCFAHNLNLIIKDALQNVEELKALLDKCKAIVTYFRHSTLASDKLKIIQRDPNKKELKLIQHVDTRWNSSLHMLSRIKEVRDELTLALNQNPNAPPNLTAEAISGLTLMSTGQLPRWKL